MPMVVPCGQCRGCRLERSRQWALRVVHEASLHDRNSFLTLTYDDSEADEGVAPVSLQKGHLQKFFKRARKDGCRFRYYACGEYGSALGRPHYHVCMFGEDFRDDMVPWKKGAWLSPRLRRLWGHGNVLAAELDFGSAQYVAKYCMKKMNGEKAFHHYMRCDSDTGELIEVSPEFSLMSRGNAASKGKACGIGAGWFEHFAKEVVRDDSCLAQGRESRPPRYYDGLASELYQREFERNKEKRKELAARRSANFTDEKLRIKAKRLDVRLQQQVRSYET